MKRLMEEGASELERSLLEAGSDVGGSERGKAKLLATLAAGTLVGVGAAQTLGVSKAWGAWFSSTTAKVGLVSALTVGAGAGGWAAQRSWSQPESQTTASGVASARSRAAGSTAIAEQAAPDQSGAPASPAASALHAMPNEAAFEVNDHSAPTGPGAAPAEAQQPDRESEPPVKRATPRREVEPRAPSVTERKLLEETALLEQLRSAVEAGDRARAEKLSRRYWQLFPAGQLAPEASRLDGRWRALTER